MKFIIAILSLMMLGDFCTSSPVDLVKQSSMDFALQLYNTISQDTPSSNVLISPFSVRTALALAFIGTNGKTSEEISSVLKLGTLDRTKVAFDYKTLLNQIDNGNILQIANKIYPREGLNISLQFKKIATEEFHSGIENVDYKNSTAAVAIINSWVENQTNGKIKNLFSASSLSSDTSMVLVNAIYFKGNWRNPFDSKTSPMTFNQYDGSKSQVDMMHVDDMFKMAELDNKQGFAVEMDYKNSNLSMLIVLPNQGVNLKDVEKSLNPESLVSLARSLKYDSVSVAIPNFKNEYSVELKNVLSKMGMPTAFTDQADFSNMLEDSQPQAISDVVHKTFIEVNPEGTEAAAATGVKIQPLSVKIPAQRFFIADRPFLYIIKDNTGNIFFIGRLLKV